MHAFFQILWVVSFGVFSFGQSQQTEETASVMEENLLLKERTGFEDQQKDPLGVLASSSSPIDRERRNAQLAIRQCDYQRAESIYLKTLERAMPLKERLNLLLELGDLYQLTHQRVKYIATLENFVALAQGDLRVPHCYLELGRTYRELGDFKRAQVAFGNVLTSSLSGNKEGVEVLKDASLRAKIEMTDTYIMMGDWSEAARYLKRLQSLNLAKSDRDKIDFQLASLSFNQGNYGQAAADLKRYIQDHAKGANLLEARFLMAMTYRRLGQFNESLKEVLSLLQDDTITEGATPESILYWKGRAGNQVANAFYEQGDYAHALTIYQSLVPLNDSYTWQWPVLYQIGLCFERLRMYQKAADAYSVVVNGDDSQTHAHPPAKEPLTPYLIATQESARWHLKQMEWALHMEESIKTLTPPDVDVSS